MSLEPILTFLDKVNETELANEVAEVFGKHAQSFQQFDDVSKTFFKIKNYDRSIYYGERALSIASTPQEMYIIRSNLVNVYNHNNAPEKALRYIKANESVLEHDNDRDFEKAYSYFLSNRKTEAAALLRSKLNDSTLTEEQRVKLDFNLGTYDLIEGNFQKGLKGFLVDGEKMGIHNTQTFMNQNTKTYGLPKWNGMVKPGMNLLIIAEAGIGDEIINVRFVEKVQSYGINCIWLSMESRVDLMDLFVLNGVPAVKSIDEVSKDFLQNAVYIPSMQLPIALNSKVEDLWSKHYLPNTFQEYDDKWYDIIHYEKKWTVPGNRLKIGVRYRGSGLYDQDLHRSIPLEQMYNAIKESGIDADIFSIQKDEGIEELDQFDDIIPLHDKLESLKDLFSAIKQLDIIITSCTSCAHIAAAMGKRVYIIVPISCYYTWCQPGDKTNWYGDNVTVLYQKTPRSWKEPLEQVSKLL